MLFSLALQMHGMPKAQEMCASCAGGASRYLYVLYIYIHICTVIGFSSCCSTTQCVFENWLCMQSHICGSLRLFAHFLCERGKLGANSTLVPSWGREGPRKNRGKRKQARRPHQLAQGVSAYCSTMSLCVYHDLGA